MRKTSMIALAALGWAVTPTVAKDKAPPEASIPLANHGGIYNFEADGENAIYIQDRFMHWYHATLMGPCTDLPFAEAIGYQVDGTDTFDHFSSIIVRGQRSALDTFTASGPPPKKPKKDKKG